MTRGGSPTRVRSPEASRACVATLLRDNALGLACLSAFAILATGMVLTGWHVFNSDQLAHGDPPLSMWSYFAQGHVWEALFENWESEFLQMAAYVVLTAYLVQRGSAESKDPDEPSPPDAGPGTVAEDAPWPVCRGGVVLRLYEHSLALAFSLLFLGSLLGHAFGVAAYNEELTAHGDHAVSTWQYASSSQFWFESFQNWQSEFLAVLAIVLLSVWLRQWGSPESKPVHASHDETGNG